MIRPLKILESKRLSLPTLLEELLNTFGDRPVSYHDDLRNFNGFHQRVQGLAGLWAEVTALDRFLRHTIGPRPGGRQRIAIYKTNDARYFRWFLAIIRAGHIAVPINPLLSFHEAEQILGSCAAKAVITDRATIVPHCLASTAHSGMIRIQDPGEALLPGFVQPTKDLLGTPALPAVDVGWDETLAIFFTSGTMGRPKGAMLTSRSLLKGRSLAALISPIIGRQDSALFPLPWAHIFAVTTAIVGLLTGVPAHFMTRFDAPLAIDIIHRNRITAFIGVPAMLIKLMDANPSPAQLRTIRLWVSAGDHLPPTCRSRLMTHGALWHLFGQRAARPMLINAYGMVELGGVAMISVDAPFIPGKGAYHLPLPHTQVRIVDEQDQHLPRGVVGECQVKSAANTTGYLDAPKATQGLLTADQWVRTGDLAKRNRLGLVKLMGRSKEVIKSGGYLIHPQEIEDVLNANPVVRRALVIGIPHAQLGEIPIAFMENRRGSRLDEADIRQWCRTRLAAFKQPREIHIVESGKIPQGPTDKALRNVLREKIMKER